jgi:4a-hydroxytetrahydrobiopterin dehydratase
MTILLTERELATHLPHLHGWHGDSASLERTVEAKDFPTAIDLVGQVALVAEELDHHPDMDIRWRKVTFRCSTHSAGGVTGKDIELIERINALVEALTA